MAIKRILVVGGAGYIGRALVEKLSRKFDVTLMIRCEIKGLKNKFFIGDLLDKESLINGVKGFDLVINLASVVRSLNKKKYRENVIGLKNLIEVLEKNKIRKLIYFSTINVNLKSRGYYAESKAECEALLKNSKLDYLTVRPNYVYEIGTGNNFFKFASLIYKFNMAFVIGKGDNKFQPILREDLADVVLDLIKSYKPGRIVEVCGKENITINDLILKIGEQLGKKPFVFRAPVWLVKYFGFLLRFDVLGADEDRVSNFADVIYGKSSFSKDLIKIVELVK